MQICKSIKRQIPKGTIVNDRLLTEMFDLTPPSTIHDLQEQVMTFAVNDNRYVTHVQKLGYYVARTVREPAKLT